MTARELIEEQLKTIKEQYTVEGEKSEILKTFNEGMYQGARIELESLLRMMDLLKIE